MVAPFKKGPDYIDPMWLSMAAGRSCYTLDFFTMSEEEILQLYHQHRAPSGITLMEGNKGLYDGLATDGSDCNAAMAKLLGLPVVLVINTNGITRGVAPLLLGYRQFDPNVQFAGVILNQTASPRHEQKLCSVVKHYTDFEVLGVVRRDSELVITERHLGLVPSNEAGAAHQQIASIARRVAEQVDIDRLLQATAASTAGSEEESRNDLDATSATVEGLTLNTAPTLRIAIARDEAFGFYYPADLEALERVGVELVPFSPIHDTTLPMVDGLLIGGGFPETHMDLLQNNRAMRQQIRQMIESGVPAYAECGGLMYLARSIEWGDRKAEMVGVVAAEVTMHDSPQGRGYVLFRHHDQEEGGEPLPAHEFHYSSLQGLAPEQNYAFVVERGVGIDGHRDGVVYKNLIAGYLHQRNTRQNDWVKRFVTRVRQHQLQGKEAE